MGGVGRVVGCRRVGGKRGERTSGWSLPPSPSLSIHWGRNILDVQGRPPLVEGQGGFPLERREIVASLGKEKAGSTLEVLSTIDSALGMAPH